MSSLLNLLGYGPPKSQYETIATEKAPRFKKLSNLKDSFLSCSKLKKGLIIGTSLVAVLAIAAAAMLIYAKFGHQPALNYWMNHQLQPFLANAAHQSGEWLGSHTLPTWVSVALGTTAVAGTGVLGGMATKAYLQHRKQQQVSNQAKLIY